MTVSCESCAAAFRIDSSKLGTKGANVRCGKCGHVFFVEPEGPVISSMTDQLFMISSAPPDPESLPFGEVIPIEERSPPPPPKPAPQPEKGASPPQRTHAPPEKTATPARNTPLPATKSDTLSRRPFAARRTPAKQRVVHASIVALMLLLGCLFGLLALGVKPLPRDLSLLLRYGKRSVPDQLQILGYAGRIQELSPTERAFRITGEVLNNSTEILPAPMLRMELFAPNGEFLLKQTFVCCSERLDVGTVKPFATQVDLGNILEIGSYRISLER